LFEANGTILNVYSEHSEPRKMFDALFKAHLLTVVLAFLIGTLSYFAFGNELHDIVLYNLPADKPFTIVT